jgi:hypothetical protein
LTYEEAFKRANTTIADAYPTKTYNATYEAQPGRNTGHLPQSVGAPLDERLAYFNDLRSRWGTAPMGRDAIYAGLGTPGTGNRMRVLPTEQMTGMYQPPGQDPTGNPFPLEQNPGEIARPMGTFRTPPEGKPKDFIGPEEFHPYKQATPADRAILDAGEHLRAALDAQDAGSWHKWWQGGPAWQNNSLFFPRSAAGPGKMGDLLSLQGTGAPYGVPDVTDSMQGALMTRFYPHRDFLPGAEDKTFNQAIKQKVFSNAAGNLGLEPPIRVRVDSNLANLVDEWKQGEGSGAVTRKVLDYVTKTPEMRVAFNANPYLPERALAKFERDKDWAGKWGAPRQDIQTLREVIGDSKGDWIDRLEQALRDKSISLPAVAALLAGTAALAHAPGQEDRGGL